MHFDLSGHVASTLASSELSAHGGEAWQKGDGAEKKRGCPEVNFEIRARGGRSSSSMLVT